MASAGDADSARRISPSASPNFLAATSSPALARWATATATSARAAGAHSLRRRSRRRPVLVVAAQHHRDVGVRGLVGGDAAVLLDGRRAGVIAGDDLDLLVGRADGQRRRRRRVAGAPASCRTAAPAPAGSASPPMMFWRGSKMSVTPIRRAVVGQQLHQPLGAGAGDDARIEVGLGLDHRADERLRDAVERLPVEDVAVEARVARRRGVAGRDEVGRAAQRRRLAGARLEEHLPVAAGRACLLVNSTTPSARSRDQNVPACAGPASVAQGPDEDGERPRFTSAVDRNTAALPATGPRGTRRPSARLSA